MKLQWVKFDKAILKAESLEDGPALVNFEQAVPLNFVKQHIMVIVDDILFQLVLELTLNTDIVDSDRSQRHNPCDIVVNCLSQCFIA